MFKAESSAFLSDQIYFTSQNGEAYFSFHTKVVELQNKSKSVYSKTIEKFLENWNGRYRRWWNEKLQHSSLLSVTSRRSIFFWLSNLLRRPPLFYLFLVHVYLISEIKLMQKSWSSYFWCDDRICYVSYASFIEILFVFIFMPWEPSWKGYDLSLLLFHRCVCSCQDIYRHNCCKNVCLLTVKKLFSIVERNY